MFDKFFEKYPKSIIVGTPTDDDINFHYNKLPKELLEFWKKYGFGIFMDGYLKLINPRNYQDSLNEAYNNSDNKEIVFGITAFGDYLVWVGDAIRLIKFRYGTYNIIENDDDMTWFFDMDLADESYVNSNLFAENYSEARKFLGDLEYDECYGYFPILAAGGPEKVENLQKVKIKEHISLISQLAGKIE